MKSRLQVICTAFLSISFAYCAAGDQAHFDLRLQTSGITEFTVGVLIGMFGEEAASLSGLHRMDAFAHLVVEGNASHAVREEEHGAAKLFGYASRYLSIIHYILTEHSSRDFKMLFPLAVEVGATEAAQTISETLTRVTVNPISPTMRQGILLGKNATFCAKVLLAQDPRQEVAAIAKTGIVSMIAHAGIKAYTYFQ